MSRPPPLHPCLKSIDELIAEKTLQIEELRHRRRDLQLQALVTARNLMQSYQISVVELDTTSIDAEVNACARSDTPVLRNVRRVVSVRNPTPASLPETRLGGPLARLSSTVRTVLANQGFTTFAAISQLVDSGGLHQVKSMGPTREAALRQWLEAERHAVMPSLEGASV